MRENLAVETRDLVKRYGKGTVAVNELNLRVRCGEVYGLLGSNGAGKTTTLKMLLGLIRPTAGDVRVMGEQPGTSVGLARVGALVESPGFYPYLSGRDNLGVVARYCERSAKGRIDKVLDQVGLTKRSKDGFAKYSLGMKQRLGIAAALLKDPELIILDEPTNGLDPNGMAEIRSFIRSFVGEGKTVLLSSHLLGEVEQICDRVGIISKGELVVEGTLEELRGAGGLIVEAQPIDVAARVAISLKSVRRAKIVDGALWLDADSESTAEVIRELVGAGVDVTGTRSARRPLEEIFMELTEDRATQNVE